MIPLANIVFLPVLVIYFFLKEASLVSVNNILNGRENPIWNATYTDKLRQDLLLNYDKFARPSQHFNATTVHFGFIVRHIELDELKSQFIVHAWLQMIWNDEKLKWNPNDYGGITEVNIANHEIWQPDIFIFNSADEPFIDQYGTTHYMVYSNGHVLWVPTTRLTALCNLDFNGWPFDKQQCSINLGSWTYKGDQIDMVLYNNQTKAELNLVIDNAEWRIVDTSMEINPLSAEMQVPYVSVSFSIARKSSVYAAIMISPIIAIMVMTLLTFWLPPYAGEKVTLNSTSVIICVLFLLYCSFKMPSSGTGTPLIVSLYSSFLYLISTSLLGSVAVIWISRSKHNKVLPWIIKQPLTGKFGKILALHIYMKQTSLIMRRVTAEEMRDHQVTETEELSSTDDHHFSEGMKPQPFHQDWILFAAAIDRILFILHAFIFAILAFVYTL